MRIQEHIFQGFFGNKTKKDALKYYKEKEPKLLDNDKRLDEAIEEFQKKNSHHKKKVLAYNAFLQKKDQASLNALITEIKKLEGMFDEDEKSNDLERHQIEHIHGEIKKNNKDEDDTELKNIEREMMDDLTEIESLIDNTGNLWEKQIDIAERAGEILRDQQLQAQLDTLFKEESQIIAHEEVLLKNIDLKLGVLLRKTTLKLKDLEKTDDMNMQYREIKHIR